MCFVNEAKCSDFICKGLFEGPLPQADSKAKNPKED